MKLGVVDDLVTVRPGNCPIVVVAGFDVEGAVCSVSNVALFEIVVPLSMSPCVTL